MGASLADMMAESMVQLMAVKWVEESAETMVFQWVDSMARSKGYWMVEMKVAMMAD